MRLFAQVGVLALRFIFNVEERPLDRLNFITMIDESHTAGVLAMMRGLYAEDESETPPVTDRFPVTIQTLLSEPSKGRVILFMDDATLSGYALLIPFWSNEFGGTLLFVDELFVKPSARNRGIARRFFDFLISQRPFDAVSLGLELSPSNKRAQRLYDSIGFIEGPNATLTYDLPPRHV